MFIAETQITFRPAFCSHPTRGVEALDIEISIMVSGIRYRTTERIMVDQLHSLIDIYFDNAKKILLKQIEDKDDLPMFNTIHRLLNEQYGDYGAVYNHKKDEIVKD